jgi:hypothetical protein
MIKPIDIKPAILRIPTKPIEYAKQLARILEKNPQMDLAEFARRIDKTVDWVTDRLGLLKLIPELQKKVDNLEIDLQAAIDLSKLPEAEQRRKLK